MSVPTTRSPATNMSSNIKSRINDINDRSPNRSSATSSTGQGLARNPSFRSARPVRKSAPRVSISGDVDLNEDETKAANAQIIADLKEQVERAEQASDQYRKQLDALQKKLDSVAFETTAAEEREFQFRTQIDKLQAELRENVRQSRELELNYDSERNLLLQDRERQASKEAELHTVVNRLTENLKFKSQEFASISRQGSLPLAHEEDEVRNANASASDHEYQQAMLEKNNAIETLRFELADLHLKIAEQEHMGDGRLQILEKEVVDTKMRNARLQEENESFQMLLSEKTLKGDFMHDQQSQPTTNMSSLAEELESAGEGSVMTDETYKLMEAENKAMRESNKALTLYIDKIIGRLLQHEGFEHIIRDKDDAPEPPIKTEVVNKALPDVPSQTAVPTLTSMGPPQSTPTPPTSVGNAASAAAGFLQRARSVVTRPGPAKARPMSFLQPSVSAHENPDTAPSVPINRTHRRARSDQENISGAAAAAIVHQMNKSSGLRNTSGGPLSPGISPLSPASNQNRMSYFGPANNTSRKASDQPPTRPESSSNSVVSERSIEQERESTDASSHRASIYGPATGGPVVPGAVMKQNQLRPLRLVQEQVTEEDQKKANRGSWMGWFQKGTVEASHE